MKILLLTSSFSGGGITSYAHELISNYAKDNKLSVIIGHDNVNPIDRTSVTVYNLNVDKDLSKKNAIKVLDLINNHIKPDVIINSNSALMSLISPYVNQSIRIISISHSLRYIEADVAGFNSEYIDNIVALSTYNKLYLEKRFSIKNKNKVKVVYNFVQQPKDRFEVISKKIKNEPLNIVYAGGTAAAKSPEIVFTILRKLLKTDKVFKFYFMGAKAPTLKSIQKYNSLEELLPRDERVIFTGRLPRQQAEKLIGTANIFLVPSRREGCPIAMLEAMRYGTIILTSDFDNACKEMIINNKDGFVIKHKEIDSFVNRIIDIIDHHNLYLNFYEESYQKYLNNFSYLPWKTKMDSIISDEHIFHKKRYTCFSTSKYLYDVTRFKLLKRRNKYHMIFFEILKSASFFYIQYFKRNKSNK